MKNLQTVIGGRKVQTKVSDPLAEVVKEYMKRHHITSEHQFVRMAIEHMLGGAVTPEATILQSLQNMQTTLNYLSDSIEQNTEFLGYYIKKFFATIPPPPTDEAEAKAAAIVTDERFEKWFGFFLTYLKTNNPRLLSRINEGALLKQREAVEEEGPSEHA
jgi:hypothetical protein